MTPEPLKNELFHSFASFWVKPQSRPPHSYKICFAEFIFALLPGKSWHHCHPGSSLGRVVFNIPMIRIHHPLLFGVLLIAYASFRLYRIAKRRFNRRTITGISLYPSYRRSLLTRLKEGLGTLLAVLLLLAGILFFLIGSNTRHIPENSIPKPPPNHSRPPELPSNHRHILLLASAAP
jgi:hypothetical protein